VPALPSPRLHGLSASTAIVQPGDDDPTAAAGRPATPAHRATRWLWIMLACVSLGLGIVAIFLPGIPSTEFILLAAWAAGKGSPRLRAWMGNHRVFGPMIHNWQHGRIVSRRAKPAASASMSVALAVMVWTMSGHRTLLAVLAVGMACGAAWMWSRPERAPDA
jgi:uncharacterized membrane protein YbaN (DUF454 family)